MSSSSRIRIGDHAMPSLTRHKKLGDAYHLPTDDLLTHMFVCGASGFGKTVLGKGVVEECALAGVPVLAIDLKGDLTALALDAEGLTGSGARHTKLRTILGEEYDEQHAGFVSACGESGFAERASSFARDIAVRVYTPRSGVGRPVSLASFPKLGRRPDECDAQERQDYETLLQSFARAFMARLYGKSDAIDNRREEAALLNSLLRHAWESGESLEGLEGLERLVLRIVSPPVQRIGALPVEMAIEPRAREKMARRINTSLTGVERMWYAGEPLDLDRLLQRENGRTPIAILNLSHLDDFLDQAFVVSQACYAIYRWMRSKGGSTRPRLLFFIDEIGAGGGRESFYPHYPYNPPSKGPLNIIIRQGRAFGVCCLLATQNIIGVEARGLANVGTWAVGNLTSGNERSRLGDCLGDNVGSAEALIACMGGLQPGEFAIRTRRGEIHTVRERWLYSVHHTISVSQLPLVIDYLATRDELPRAGGVAEPIAQPAVEPQRRERSDTPPRSAEAPLASVAGAHVNQPAAEANQEPVLDVTVTRPRRKPLTAAAAWTLTCESQTWGLVAGSSYTIGRHPKCDIVLSDPLVSRRHVLLDVMSSGVHVRAAEGAKNPLTVDSVEVPSGEAALVDADSAEIVVGDTALQLKRA